MKLLNLFKHKKKEETFFYVCFKESLGYTCRHEMHGDVLECGEY